MTPNMNRNTMANGRSLIITACLCAALLASSCKEHSFTKGGAIPPPEKHGFLNDLADEYRVLGDFASGENSDPALVAKFYEKATRVKSGEAVAPESLESYKVPSFATHDLMQARHTLVEALDRVNAPENASMLAMAQVKFDCWLAYQPYQKRAGGYIGCRESFRQAMANVDFSREVKKQKATPKAINGPQTIHFADDMMTLNQQSHETIVAVAEQALASEGTRILLVGYSKAKTTIEDTSNNAVRRMIAVRNALYQSGVDPDLVDIEFEPDGSAQDVQLELHPGAV